MDQLPALLSGPTERLEMLYHPQLGCRKREGGMKHRVLFFGVCAGLALGLTGPAMAQDSGTLTPKEAAKFYPYKPLYSRYSGRDFPTWPLFGDTHLHTSFSMDAGAFGGCVSLQTTKESG